MPTNNVVPIDAGVARAIARRAVKFRWFVAGLAALWLGILIPVLLLTPLPPLVPFLVLGALLVLAEHRFVLFGDETSMSGSIIVAIASVFVFADTAPLAGPMLVASLGGLYLPHIRLRRASLMISNAAGFSVSALAAGATVVALGFHDTLAWPTVAVCVVVAVAVDWVINSLIVGIASAVRSGDSIRASVRAQLTSDADVLMLVIAVGALSALNADRDFVSEVLCVCLALAAFEMRLERRRVFETGPPRPIDRYLNASLIATAAMLAWSDPGLGAFAVIALAVFLAQATDRRMALPALIGLAAGVFATACCSPLWMSSVAAAALTLATAFSVIEAATVLTRARRSGRSLNAWAISGLMMLGTRELAMLGLVAIGISAAASLGIRSPAAIGLTFVAAIALVNYRANRSRRSTCP